MDDRKHVPRYELRYDKSGLALAVPDSIRIGEADTWRELRAMAAGAIPLERAGRLWAHDRMTKAVLDVADLRRAENPTVTLARDTTNGTSRKVLRHSRTCRHCGERPVEKSVFTVVTRRGRGDATKTTLATCDECAGEAARWLAAIGLDTARHSPEEDFPTDWDVLIEPLPERPETTP